MSRIHEALQKAEQERKSAQPGELSASELAIPVLPGEVPAASVPAAVEPQLPTLRPGKMESGLAGCVPAPWKPDSKSMLFFDSSKHYEVGMEEFRTLRSRLFQIREKRPLKVVLVGSALPGEGKSFVSANLAQALARQHGRRVLLIDGDLRRASLHECLGARATPGMSDYLHGTADEYAVLQRGPLDGLFFIPGGTEVANPAELIANGRCKTLLQQLAPNFDWIVIDSPPAVPVADASMLAEYCDGVLLVVRSGSTPADQAQRAAREFREKAIVGVVLNQATPASGYNGSYYKGFSGYGRPHHTAAKP
jgi:capsular exopolysaccharide synthesis family protein